MLCFMAVFRLQAKNISELKRGLLRHGAKLLSLARAAKNGAVSGKSIIRVKVATVAL